MDASLLAAIQGGSKLKKVDPSQIKDRSKAHIPGSAGSGPSPSNPPGRAGIAASLNAIMAAKQRPAFKPKGLGASKPSGGAPKMAMGGMGMGGMGGMGMKPPAPSMPKPSPMMGMMRPPAPPVAAPAPAKPFQPPTNSYGHSKGKSGGNSSGPNFGRYIINPVEFKEQFKFLRKYPQANNYNECKKQLISELQ